MLNFQYRGRIHKSKLSLRSLRYAFSDQAARVFPSLQRRWLFPIESIPIDEAALRETVWQSIAINRPVPHELDVLGLGYGASLQNCHHVYDLENIAVTGWAGAMLKDGRLLTIRPIHNWVSALRAHPHKLTILDSDRPYFNLMAPTAAKGHIFHWLYDAIFPLLSYLEIRGHDQLPGLIVNAARSEVQDITIEFVRSHYGISHIQTLSQREAFMVPRLVASVTRPHFHHAPQNPRGLAKIDALAQFLASAADDAPSPRRIYISRNDARLRRVADEDDLLPCLEEHGFERIILKSLPIREQVRLFQQAEAVVAPHGAGLAHVTWCRPGTKIIEFFPDPDGPRGRVKNRTSDYWVISQMRGLDYSCYFGGPLLNRDDGFAIGEQRLRRALEKASITSP